MRSAKPKPATLAIEGGKPVRASLLPYGRQQILEEDIQAVNDVLRSDWITTGPKVREFEEAFAATVGARHAVSFSSGTAALHAAVFAAGLEAGQEAVTTPLTFAASANCFLYQGAVPVFADVEPGTLNLDPEQAQRRIGARTRAILVVDYSGQPADLDAFRALAEKHRLVLIEDACHALGAEYKGKRVGNHGHLTVFSFHPVKHVTTGEGGMVTTADVEQARRLRLFRNHGIDSDARARQSAGQWFYEMVELGYNYRLTDIACALGLSQLKRLEKNLARRRAIAARYQEAFRRSPVRPLEVRAESNPAWHLFPVQLELEQLRVGRGEIFRALRAENIGVNVHYIPVHLHPYYRKRFPSGPGDFPVAEKAYERLISLPMFHAMTAQDIEDVIEAVTKVVEHYLRG